MSSTQVSIQGVSDVEGFLTTNNNDTDTGISGPDSGATSDYQVLGNLLIIDDEVFLFTQDGNATIAD